MRTARISRADLLKGGVSGGAALLLAGGNIANTALAQGLSQIAANEAQHLSVISLNDRSAAFQDAFPAIMTMEDSSNALGNYTA